MERILLMQSSLCLQLDNHRNQLIQVLSWKHRLFFAYTLACTSLTLFLFFFSFAFELTVVYLESRKMEVMLKMSSRFVLMKFGYIMQLELFLSSGTVCLSIYSLVAAIFGMNLPYTWREGHSHVFKWVCRVHASVLK